MLQNTDKIKVNNSDTRAMRRVCLNAAVILRVNLHLSRHILLELSFLPKTSVMELFRENT